MLATREWEDKNELRDRDNYEHEDGPSAEAHGKEDGGDDTAQGKRAKRAPAKRMSKRPKLTAAMLKEPDGLRYIFQKFPKYFAEGFGGRGNEVRDLRRLIEMYQRWQHRVFPHGTFDAFQQALEKLSSTGELRTELRAMRVELTRIVDPEDHPPQLGTMEVQWQQVVDHAGGGAGQQQPGTPGSLAGRAGPAAAGALLSGALAPAAHMHEGQGELDDDELLALQAEEAYEAALDAVPEAFEDMPRQQPVGAAAAAAAPPADVMDLEDEDVGPPVATQRHAGRRRALADWSDDDSDDGGLVLQATAQQAPQQQQQQQQQQHSDDLEDAPAAHGSPQGGSQGQRDAHEAADGMVDGYDDEMLLQMAADDDGDDYGAGSGEQQEQQQQEGLLRAVQQMPEDGDADVAGQPEQGEQHRDSGAPAHKQGGERDCVDGSLTLFIESEPQS